MGEALEAEERDWGARAFTSSLFVIPDLVSWKVNRPDGGNTKSGDWAVTDPELRLYL